MKNREEWGSKLGFILAASGSAVGIGNIWKFPHIAGQNEVHQVILLDIYSSRREFIEKNKHPILNGFGLLLS